MFKLNLNDATKAVIIAVIVAILGGVQQMLTAHGLEFAAYDWGFILNLGITAGIGYLGKNFLSDNKGAVLGVLGGVQ